MAIITLEDVSKNYPGSYGGTPAVQDTSLSLESGEFITIEGLSGSGKTSLARILGLLQAPDSGSCYLGQTDATRIGDAERTALRREHIGLVFPDFKLAGDMRARDNIEIAMSYDGVKPKDRRFHAQRLLKQVGLAERAKQPAGSLSGEQKQRLAIARALANKPWLIIADEPTNNLDPSAATIIMKMLSKLPKQGYAVAVTTHNPAIAEYGQRRLPMRQGALEHGEKSQPREANSL
ncbi:macrolide ABC transporter ATP-binding protein [Candidatus Saccharibacteria bacterium QS_5_54_17]|nr:MAG: macrolide ABC transporter ATP-binding protein [Candidatus Saccharibacteria bacterium QS_5_54_17]